ncbi:hypothetical protein ADK34_29215 [Streptomyces viridochromogenes]|uniref:Uncharacterized protein n=1 Tax=Streptomyces viridochromogenes TaxID=1938 RepID=A0A0L8JLK6_STRVR|nr:hypothetical protein ADK34_29215 [Streptomyces viridochromogenes]
MYDLRGPSADSTVTTSPRAPRTLTPVKHQARPSGVRTWRVPSGAVPSTTAWVTALASSPRGSQPRTSWTGRGGGTGSPYRPSTSLQSATAYRPERRAYLGFRTAGPQRAW